MEFYRQLYSFRLYRVFGTLIPFTIQQFSLLIHDPGTLIGIDDVITLLVPDGNFSQHNLTSLYELTVASTTTTYLTGGQSYSFITMFGRGMSVLMSVVVFVTDTYFYLPYIFKNGASEMPFKNSSALHALLHYVFGIPLMFCIVIPRMMNIALFFGTG